MKTVSILSLILCFAVLVHHMLFCVCVCHYRVVSNVWLVIRKYVESDFRDIFTVGEC